VMGHQAGSNSLHQKTTKYCETQGRGSSSGSTGGPLRSYHRGGNSRAVADGEKRLWPRTACEVERGWSGRFDDRGWRRMGGGAGLGAAWADGVKERAVGVPIIQKRA